jgi:hypothetical protein
MPLACLVLAQGAIFVFPGVASAEWTEVTWPCDVAMGATSPPPFLWPEVGESIEAPAGFFTYGEPRLEAPPLNDFTATIDWGEGTTAPAQVEATGVGDCYSVSAPSHVYAASGTYRVSYTVHDFNTGLDHKLVGETEFHIYSKMPELVGGPSSRAINAVVGTPWTGVVGEFSVAGLIGDKPLLTSPSNIYSAEIEWGDGEVPTTGTINMGSSSEPMFTVSGSHTYARSITGTIKVLLSFSRFSWMNPESLGAWTTASVNATPAISSAEVTAPRLQFDGRPLLAVIQRGSRAPLYELVFRLNRALAQTTIGDAESRIEANGHTTSIHQLIAHEATACYVATASMLGKRKLRPGARYPFALVVGGASDTRDPTYGVVRRFASVKRMHAAASKQLGCA